MAEEIKQEANKAEAKNVLSVALKVILGLVFLVLGIAAIISWRQELLIIIRGCIGLFLILAALITFAIAKE